MSVLVHFVSILAASGQGNRVFVYVGGQLIAPDGYVDKGSSMSLDELESLCKNTVEDLSSDLAELEKLEKLEK